MSRSWFSDSDEQPNRREAYCTACGRSFPLDQARCPDDGARLIKIGVGRDVVVGRVFDSRYEVRARLADGGMGTVYRGWQLSVEREVAIKVIDPRLSTNLVAVKRFLREVRLSSRLNHPNIVNVYDFGQTDDGILYIVMELLRGRTLASALAGRELEVARATAIGLQICDALECAHAQNIIHRDLKPSNVVILDDTSGRELIKVLDFGLAKSLVAEGMSAVTRTDMLLGTPLYMSPEQIEGGGADQRSDIYSLGCMFFEMLSGAPPFNDAGLNAILTRHLYAPPPPLPDHVPPALAALIERMMAKLPGDRVQSLAEVRAVLGGGEPSVLRTPAAPRSPAPARRTRHALLAVAVIGLALAGVGVLRWRQLASNGTTTAALPALPGPPLPVDTAPATQVVPVEAVPAPIATPDPAVAVEDPKPARAAGDKPHDRATKQPQRVRTKPRKRPPTAGSGSDDDPLEFYPDP